MKSTPGRSGALRTTQAVVKLLNAALTIAIVLMVAFAAMFAIWSAWDNGRVYAEAEDVREGLLSRKPTEENPTLDELVALNPDVRAWVTLDETKVDYPIVQGETNFDYLHTDVYGSYSLAGSVFLDSRCDSDFGSAYSLVYGHHMADGSMLGSLGEYADLAFFSEHKTGTLVLPNGSYDLEVLAFMPTYSGDDNIFEPSRWNEDAAGLLVHVERNAIQIDRGLLFEARTNPSVQILALTTCSSESEDARMVVVCIMKPQVS